MYNSTYRDENRKGNRENYIVGKLSKEHTQQAFTQMPKEFFTVYVQYLWAILHDKNSERE